MIDRFGRRLIHVPHRHVPAELLLCDMSDMGFWRSVAQALPGDGPLATRLGVMSDPAPTVFMAKDTVSQGPMVAEVFAHDYGLLSLGSARHMEHGRVMWKGVGRNQLAVRSDWLHSWGGLHQLEGLEEFILSQKLRSTHAVTKVKAVLAYDQELYPGQCFILRDMPLPRLASVSVRFNSEKCLRELAAVYGHELGEAGQEAWGALLKRQWDLLNAGWVARTPAVGNYDVAGRTLDMTGGRLWSGLKHELFWYDESTVSSPLDSFWWVIENALIPLHASLWKIPGPQLRSSAHQFLCERSAIFPLTPTERLQLVAQKIAAGHWSQVRSHWYTCGERPEGCLDVSAFLKKKNLEVGTLTSFAQAQSFLQDFALPLSVDSECARLLGIS